ncbi:MAG: hypothetical protein HDQ98_00075 [Lachnospiraceae bacterium]|nr:hypothetical protein [Lachnospiraceae bacterium]
MIIDERKFEESRDKLEAYLHWLINEANTSCDYKYNLRLAGQVEALERLDLIDKQLADDIRHMLTVSEKDSHSRFVNVDILLEHIRYLREFDDNVDFDNGLTEIEFFIEQQFNTK